MRHEIAGDPISGMLWTSKTTEKISLELTELGIRIKAKTVGRILKKMKYSLKTNRKNAISGGKRKPGYRKKRNLQFLNMKKIQENVKSENPTISIDTKKKETLGNFKNSGRTWSREAKVVHDHDFKSDSVGKVVPYGIYDIKKNKAFVVVGQSKDTPAFATDAIEKWWSSIGRNQYPKANEILILADSGGSNGAKSRVWRKDLQEKLCNKHKIKIRVCHFPPGSSKWNPIEHRVFSQISKNWSGMPLKNIETVVKYPQNSPTFTHYKTNFGIIAESISF